MTIRNLTIKDAKNITENITQGNGAIIIAFNKRGELKGVSWGEDKLHCKIYGKILDRIIDYIQQA